MPKAIETLHLSAAADPTYAEPLINLGICAANAGRDDEAIQYYEKAITFLHEPHQEAFANLAHLYTKKNMLEKAFYTVIPALQLNPYYTVAWEVLAQKSMNDLDFQAELIMHEDKHKTERYF